MDTRWLDEDELDDMKGRAMVVRRAEVMIYPGSTPEREVNW